MQRSGPGEQRQAGKVTRWGTPAAPKARGTADFGLRTGGGEGLGTRAPVARLRAEDEGRGTRDSGPGTGLRFEDLLREAVEPSLPEPGIIRRTQDSGLRTRDAGARTRNSELGTRYSQGTRDFEDGPDEPWDEQALAEMVRAEREARRVAREAGGRGARGGAVAVEVPVVAAAEVRPQAVGRPRQQQVRAKSANPARPGWMRMQVILPVAIIVGLLAGAMFLQPSKPGIAESVPDATTEDAALAVASTSPTAVESVVTKTETVASGSSPTPVPANMTVSALATQRALDGTSEVAGVQATATPEPVLPRTSQNCGGIQEVATPLSVEGSLSGISVRATQATSYPIEYLRCILSATGSNDASAIAQALDKAYTEGATQAVVIDLWVANGTRDFAQVNLKSASVAAAGQMFTPIATLNGKSEVVVAGGQGRAVSLVVAITNTLAPTPGAMTVTIDAPMVGGKETPGKYQIFLPTP